MGDGLMSNLDYEDDDDDIDLDDEDLEEDEEEDLANIQQRKRGSTVPRGTVCPTINPHKDAFEQIGFLFGYKKDFKY